MLGVVAVSLVIGRSRDREPRRDLHDVPAMRERGILRSCRRALMAAPCRQSSASCTIGIARESLLFAHPPGGNHEGRPGDVRLGEPVKFERKSSPGTLVRACSW